MFCNTFLKKYLFLYKKHKHLTLSDRIEIELGITQGSSF